MLKIDILAAPQTTGSILYGLYDLFKMPGEAWPRLMLGKPGQPLNRVRIVSDGGQEFRCRGGVPVAPEASLDEALDADIICVPNMTVPLDESPRDYFEAEVRWLKQNYEDGKTIATVCSGALLLAEAGLLNGEIATAHWMHRKMFHDFYPQVIFEPERILTFAGEENRLILAGGMSSWQDLALYLIARYLGPEHAVQASKIYLISDHTDGQLPYAAFSRRLQQQDPVIRDCQLWLSEHYDLADAVSRMQTLSGLARRTFSRRFKAATGYKPLEYVQALRVEEARQMFESGHLPVAEVALSVGYQDDGAFRRLFKRLTGLSPSAYRTKFQYSRFDIETVSSMPAKPASTG